MTIFYNVHDLATYGGNIGRFLIMFVLVNITFLFQLAVRKM